MGPETFRSGKGKLQGGQVPIPGHGALHRGNKLILRRGTCRSHGPDQGVAQTGGLHQPAGPDGLPSEREYRAKGQGR